jgi:photosystem II stability/assembly factor-like uncharacterized protein
MKISFLKSVLVLGVVLFYSSQIFAQWVAQTSGTTSTLRGIRVVNNDVVWACGVSGVVLKTTNGGTTWNTLTPTLSTATNYSIEAFDSTTAWVTGTVGGSADVSIWKTTDGGATWALQYNNPAGFGNALRFFDENNGVYYGDPDPFPSGNWEILTTSDGGANWNRVPQSNFPPADSVNSEYGAPNALSIFGDHVWFGTSNSAAAPPFQGRVYHSSDKGVTWTVSSVDPALLSVSGMDYKDMNTGIVCSYEGQVGVTTDGGTTWAITSLGTTALRSVSYAPGTDVFLTVGSSGKTHVSRDNGLVWDPYPQGTTLYRAVDATTENAWTVGNGGNIIKWAGAALPVELNSFNASVEGKNVNLNWSTATEINNRGFEVQRKGSAGEFVSVGFVKGHGTTQEKHEYTFTDKNLESGSYFYRLKQIDMNGVFEFSKIVEVEIRVPNKFELSQNYPNPFNPTTKISYEIAKETVVSLKVYDIIGNEIATLVNDTKPAGAYEVIFDASNLSNGVYLYKIQAGNFTATKKLILMK